MANLFRLFFSDYTDPMNIGNPTEYTIRELAELGIDPDELTEAIRWAHGIPH